MGTVDLEIALDVFVVSSTLTSVLFFVVLVLEGGTTGLNRCGVMGRPSPTWDELD